MPCRPVHALCGTVVGVATFFALVDTKSEDNQLQGAAVTAAGYFGGILPDIIEPAIHPHHRQFFHSLAVLGGISVLLKTLYDWQPVTADQKFFRLLLLALCAGYFSHLFLDALTPRSIPMIGSI